MALKFLLATLQSAGAMRQPLIRVRQLLGLCMFAWCDLPASSTVREQQSGSAGLDYHRPYLTLGAISWAILLALAVTSTQAMQRKLGRRWQLLQPSIWWRSSRRCTTWSVKIVSPQPVIYALLWQAIDMALQGVPPGGAQSGNAVSADLYHRDSFRVAVDNLPDKTSI